MADISNKTVSILLLTMIVVSLGGIVLVFEEQDLGITGRSTTQQRSGTTNFSINSTLSIVFINNNVNFGLGYVNDSFLSCKIGTNDTANVGCIGLTPPPMIMGTNNLTIENNGNIPANVSIRFQNTAANFIGGSLDGGPSIQYRVSNNESGSCKTIGNGSAFTEVGATETGNYPYGAHICTWLNATPDNMDSIQIGIWMRIPKDAPTGAHNEQINATGCDDGTC